jgi:hypothetical protein
MTSFLRLAGCVFFGLLAVAEARAQDRALQKKINDAIDRGVQQLRSAFGTTGLAEYEHDKRYATGMTALVAWTLLEAGVPADDPVVEKTAALLRARVVRATNTYDLAMAILFFDRLGYAADEPFIEGMAVRLLAGQDKNGGWTYPAVLYPAGEVQLCRYMQRALNKWEKGKKYTTRMPKELPLEIKNFLRAKGPVSDNPPDGSNTQFAMLALWVARRHGLPTDEALLKVAKCFRQAQLPGGGWDYQLSARPQQPPVPGKSYGGKITMTCAGLLAIALEHGIAKKQKKAAPPLKDDAAALAGLNVLGHYLRNSEEPEMKRLLAGDIYFDYFLFSMERMAVIYDLKRIDETDWYVWGAEKLVKTQLTTGNWPGLFGAADTCFALLFLKRANVARDLTLDLMKGIVREREPSVAPKKKNERERDPFDVPKIKDKKTKSQPSSAPKKESRQAAPRGDSSQVAQDLLEEVAQQRFREKTKAKVAPAENVVGGRLGAARLQARLEQALTLL